MDNSNEAIAARQSLNHSVTDRLGWHIMKVDPPEIMEGDDPLIGHYRIVNKWTLADGNNRPVMRPWSTVGNVWEHAPIPNYSEELETAFTLFDLVPEEYTPRVVRLLKAESVLAYFWRAVIIDNTTKQTFEGDADYPAEAITLCWLNWHRRTS